MSFLRRRKQAREKRAELRRTAPQDRALFDRAREIVDEEVGELADGGRVTIEPHWDEGEISGGITIRPAASESTGIALSIWSDVVAFHTGEAGACNEIWSTVDDDWERTLRQMIGCVRDGRYSERVSKGRLLFPLKVDMRFEGVPSGPDDRYPDFTPGYASTLAAEDGPEPMPPTGDFRYEPW